MVTALANGASPSSRWRRFRERNTARPTHSAGCGERDGLQIQSDLTWGITASATPARFAGKRQDDCQPRRTARALRGLRAGQNRAGSSFTEPPRQPIGWPKSEFDFGLQRALDKRPMKMCRRGNVRSALVLAPVCRLRQNRAPAISPRKADLLAAVSKSRNGRRLLAQRICARMWSLRQRETYTIVADGGKDGAVKPRSRQYRSARPDRACWRTLPDQVRRSYTTHWPPLEFGVWSFSEA
jgi:hypothetical protein